MNKNKILPIAILSFAIGLLSACGQTGNGDNNPKESNEKPPVEHEHTYSSEWSKDDSKHWHAATCEHTEEKSDLAEHTFGDDNKCKVCGYEKFVGETEFCYFFNSATTGVPIEIDHEAYKTEAIAFEVNDTIKFGDAAGTYVSINENITISGDNQGFTCTNGVLKASYAASYIFTFEGNNVSIKANGMTNPYVGAIYVAGQRNMESPFYFKKIDGESQVLEYKITNANIPAVPVTITLQIEKNSEVIVVNEIIAGGASADFTLSQDGKTLTYVGAGGVSYNFYVRDSYASNHVGLYIEVCA